MFKMIVSNQGEDGRDERKLVEAVDFALEKLFSEFDQKTGPQLAIFDGTSNQKLVILAWMVDNLEKEIEEFIVKGKGNVDQSDIATIRKNALAMTQKVQEQASEITGSTSLLSEGERKTYIERYARIIDIYRKNVEAELKNPSLTLANSNLLKESQSIGVPPLPKGVLLDISTFLRDFHLENSTFVETEEKEDCKTLGFFIGTRHSVPMTPILGVTNSKYVSPKTKGINIHEGAYADGNGQRAYVPFEIHLNDTYEEVLYNVPKNLTYVGAKYPDGSSLSYLPIKDITVLRRPSCVQLPSHIEGGYVELRISRIAYEKIMTMCTSAYLAKNPDHSIRYPVEIEADSESIVIEALARGYRRLRIINGESIYHVTLLEAIESCSHDLTGDGLLHLRFDKQTSDEKKATMKFVFFGLQMVRTAKNHFQRIFRM